METDFWVPNQNQSLEAMNEVGEKWVFFVFSIGEEMGPQIGNIRNPDGKCNDFQKDEKLNSKDVILKMIQLSKIKKLKSLDPKPKTHMQKTHRNSLS